MRLGPGARGRPWESRRGALGLALRIGRCLERHGLLERASQNSYLAGDALEALPMEQLLGSSLTCRIPVGQRQGRQGFKLQTLPASDAPFNGGIGKAAGFSLPDIAGMTGNARVTISGGKLPA